MSKKHTVSGTLISKAYCVQSIGVLNPSRNKNISFIEQRVYINFEVFTAKEFIGEIELSKDHTEFKWLSIKELKDSKLDLAPIVSLYFKI